MSYSRREVVDGQTVMNKDLYDNVQDGIDELKGTLNDTLNDVDLYTDAGENLGKFKVKKVVKAEVENEVSNMDFKAHYLPYYESGKIYQYIIDILPYGDNKLCVVTSYFIFIYDYETDEWVKKADMPSSFTIAQYSYSQCVTDGVDVYFFVGRDLYKTNDEGTTTLVLTDVLSEGAGANHKLFRICYNKYDGYIYLIDYGYYLYRLSKEGVKTQVCGLGSVCDLTYNSHSYNNIGDLQVNSDGRLVVLLGTYSYYNSYYNYGPKFAYLDVTVSPATITTSSYILPVGYSTSSSGSATDDKSRLQTAMNRILIYTFEDENQNNYIVFRNNKTDNSYKITTYITEDFAYNTTPGPTPGKFDVDSLGSDIAYERFAFLDDKLFYIIFDGSYQMAIREISNFSKPKPKSSTITKENIVDKYIDTFFNNSSSYVYDRTARFFNENGKLFVSRSSSTSASVNPVGGSIIADKDKILLNTLTNVSSLRVDNLLRSTSSSVADFENGWYFSGETSNVTINTEKRITFTIQNYDYRIPSKTITVYDNDNKVRTTSTAGTAVSQVYSLQAFSYCPYDRKISIAINISSTQSSSGYYNMLDRYYLIDADEFLNSIVIDLSEYVSHQLAYTYNSSYDNNQNRYLGNYVYSDYYRHSDSYYALIYRDGNYIRTILDQAYNNSFNEQTWSKFYNYRSGCVFREGDNLYECSASSNNFNIIYLCNIKHLKSYELRRQVNIASINILEVIQEEYENATAISNLALQDSYVYQGNLYVALSYIVTRNSTTYRNSMILAIDLSPLRGEESGNKNTIVTKDISYLLERRETNE